jgi:nucleoside triphosphate diphosphatase
MADIETLLDIMKRLRHPDKGCPWDIRQTSASIAPHTLEETHEVLEAIETGDHQNLKEELGDLLFNIVFHAQIAEEQNHFKFKDVVDTVVEKMIRRHPHVFNNPGNTIFSEVELKNQWQKIKQQEKGSKPKPVFAEESQSLPAIYRAREIQKNAAQSGFDWPDINPVLDKLDEEIEELKSAISSQDRGHIADELGDVLFVLVNIGRHLKIDPETSLRSTNQKFVRRFNFVQQEMNKAGVEMTQTQLDLMEEHWQAAKTIVDKR